MRVFDRRPDDAVARQLGDPEVEDLDGEVPAAAVVEGEEDVFGLEVAMDDALGVRGRQRAGNLPGHRCDRRGLAREAAHPLERGPQALALQILHDDVRAIVDDLAVVDLDDPGVLDGREWRAPR